MATVQENPLVEGLERLPVHPTALSIFGATQEGGALPVYSQVMAAALVTAAPVVLLYMIFQRYLVGGLTAGGVK